MPLSLREGLPLPPLARMTALDFLRREKNWRAASAAAGEEAERE